MRARKSICKKYFHTLVRERVRVYPTRELEIHKLVEGIYEELVMLDKVLKGEAVEDWKKE